jgi:glutamate synthase (NADPH/NADH) large chain
VYDEDGSFAQRCNTSMVTLEKVLTADEQKAADVPMHKGQADEALLKSLVEQQHRWTGSLRAREILDNWATSRAKFVKVFPTEYRRALTELAAKGSAAASVNEGKAAAPKKAASVGKKTPAK